MQNLANSYPIETYDINFDHGAKMLLSMSLLFSSKSA